MPAWQTHFAADDYVEYTWHAPTTRIHSTVPVLKAPNTSFGYPAWAHNALTGVPAAIDPGIFVGAKTVAATMMDVLTRPDVLARATDEFRQRTGGGVGGDKWVAPLLPKDFAPPIDLRWPEYIQTVRGEEWWLPTPAVGFGCRANCSTTAVHARDGRAISSWISVGQRLIEAVNMNRSIVIPERRSEAEASPESIFLSGGHGFRARRGAVIGPAEGRTRWGAPE